MMKAGPSAWLLCAAIGLSCFTLSGGSSFSVEACRGTATERSPIFLKILRTGSRIKFSQEDPFVTPVPPCAADATMHRRGNTLSFTMMATNNHRLSNSACTAALSNDGCDAESPSGRRCRGGSGHRPPFKLSRFVESNN